MVPSAGRPAGQPDGAVAAEGADLEHPAGAGDAHEQLEQLALVGGDLDLGEAGGGAVGQGGVEHVVGGQEGGDDVVVDRGPQLVVHPVSVVPPGAVAHPNLVQLPTTGGGGCGGRGAALDVRRGSATGQEVVTATPPVPSPGAKHGLPTVSDMLRDEFLRSIPKIELHCHIEGSVRAATFADQAKKHGIALPTDDVEKLYDYETIYEFLVIFGMVSSTLIDQDDFARVAYEAMEDGHRLGNLRYREMFFNPTLHTRRGVPMKTIVDGLAEGINAAEVDFGVKGRLIADVYRQDDPADCLQMVEELFEVPAPRGHRPRDGRGRGPRPAREVRRLVPRRQGGRAAPHQPCLRGRPAGEHHHVPRPARLRADRPRLPHPLGPGRHPALPRRRHPLHRLPHVDGGRLRLARPQPATRSSGWSTPA